jgi:hypothetical protein
MKLPVAAVSFGYECERRTQPLLGGLRGREPETLYGFNFPKKVRTTKVRIPA